MLPTIFSHAKFDLDALLALASRLRGQPCSVDTSMRPKTGSMNWVIFITFEDGIEWAFRSPRVEPSAIFTKQSASTLLISEASTLKYLGTFSSVPVPEIYSFSGDYDNEVGVPYILMSKACGRPLSEYEWDDMPQIARYQNLPPRLSITDHDREKVMRQLGSIMSCLSELRFDKIGSLFQDSDGNYFTGECLSPSLFWQFRDELEDIDRGPFDQVSDYFHSLISAFTSHAEELPLTPHSFFAPIPIPTEYPDWTSYLRAAHRWSSFCSVSDGVEGPKNRLSFCIAGQFLKKMVPRLATSTKDGDFVLSHPDLHPGNIFVDDEFNITCILDWSSASSCPVAQLLATPGPNGSLVPPKPTLTAAFRSGFYPKSFSAEQWSRADRIWHFIRLVRMLSKQDYTHFKSLYDLVYGTTDSGEIPRLFHEQSMQEAGKALLVKLCEEDDKEESENGETRKSDGDDHDTAVARKLTLMSEMNPSFVADKRLWLWIDKALEQPADFK